MPYSIDCSATAAVTKFLDVAGFNRCGRSRFESFAGQGGLAFLTVFRHNLPVSSVLPDNRKPRQNRVDDRLVNQCESFF